MNGGIHRRDAETQRFVFSAASRVSAVIHPTSFILSFPPG